MTKEPTIIPDFTADAHERALEAKSDYLGQLPGDIYRITREDIDRVWHLVESPIEQVALLQLAGVNYAYKGPPVYAKVCLKRGEVSLLHYPVQLIPQVEFGPYRVDFLFEISCRQLLAVECDGADFHLDKERDRARDEHLKSHYGVSVLRCTGKDIWRNNEAIELVASVIQARLM